jgi:hypothetical protein
MTLGGPVHCPWIITTYESLLEQKEAEVNRILDALAAPVPEGLSTQFAEPSHSASDNLKVEDVEEQLSKWRDDLSAGQAESILRIVSEFGLDFYTDKLRPNLDRLRQLAETESSSIHPQSEDAPRQ